MEGDLNSCIYRMKSKAQKLVERLLAEKPTKPVNERNMSYCRFENTLTDLQDCYHALSDGEANDKALSQYERPAKRSLIQLCGQIVEEFGENFGNIDASPEDEEDFGGEDGAEPPPAPPSHLRPQTRQTPPPPGA